MLTLSQAYLSTVRELVNYGDRLTVNGVPVRELLNHKFEVEKPQAIPLVTHSERINTGLVAGVHDMLQVHGNGERRSKYYPAGVKSLPDGSTASAYGYLINEAKSVGKCSFAKHPPVTPWESAKVRLMMDAHTRQAIMPILLPKHLWIRSPDVPSASYLQFFIRDEKLHLTANMRASDFVPWFPFDSVYFAGLMVNMVYDLRNHYPRLSIGTYTQFTGSLYMKEAALETALEVITPTEELLAA